MLRDRLSENLKQGVYTQFSASIDLRAPQTYKRRKSSIVLLIYAGLLPRD